VVSTSDVGCDAEHGPGSSGNSNGLPLAAAVATSILRQRISRCEDLKITTRVDLGRQCVSAAPAEADRRRGDATFMAIKPQAAGPRRHQHFGCEASRCRQEGILAGTSTSHSWLGMMIKETRRPCPTDAGITAPARWLPAPTSHPARPITSYRSRRNGVAPLPSCERSEAIHHLRITGREMDLIRSDRNDRL